MSEISLSPFERAYPLPPRRFGGHGALTHENGKRRGKTVQAFKDCSSFRSTYRLFASQGESPLQNLFNLLQSDIINGRDAAYGDAHSWTCGERRGKSGGEWRGIAYQRHSRCPVEHIREWNRARRNRFRTRSSGICATRRGVTISSRRWRPNPTHAILGSESIYVKISAAQRKRSQSAFSWRNPFFPPVLMDRDEFDEISTFSANSLFDAARGPSRSHHIFVLGTGIAEVAGRV